MFFGVIILVGVMQYKLDPFWLTIPLVALSLLIAKISELNEYPPQNLIRLLKSYYKLTFPNSLILLTLIIGIIQIGPSTTIKDILNVAVKSASYSIFFGLMFGGLIAFSEILRFRTLEELLEKHKDADCYTTLGILLMFFLMHVVYLGIALLMLAIPYIYKI